MAKKAKDAMRPTNKATLDKIIKFPHYNIEVTLYAKAGHKSGIITSDLPVPKEKLAADKGILGEDINGDKYNAAIDAVESLILAHACAGIDIMSPAYVEGVETAIEAISNQFYV